MTLLITSLGHNELMHIFFQLEELLQIPEKMENDKVELQKKLEKLEKDKEKEEEKLKEVMESLKTETQVRGGHLAGGNQTLTH